MQVVPSDLFNSTALIGLWTAWREIGMVSQACPLVELTLFRLRQSFFLYWTSS